MLDKPQTELLSEEWMELVKLATELNVSQEKFKEFLAQYAAKSKKTNEEQT
ncbi:hypothetical protein ACQKGA_18825 [Priestia megaterium]|uniref:hypothetical protein n=1 Tax=Priestia megaterium TaxID=1404 RepID=UPI003D02BDFE